MQPTTTHTMTKPHQINLLHDADEREAGREREEDGPSPLEWLLGELDRMDGCPDTKDRMRTLLRSMAGHRVYLSRGLLVTPERKRIARGLLDAGFTATQARAELAARCGFSRRTAERLVAEVLQDRALEAIRERQMVMDLEGDNAGTH